MRALRFARFGPPDVLHVEEVPEPVPPPGHAKVRVHAVSLNPLDWKIRAGHLAMLPIAARPPRGLGCDFAGEIVAVGGGATEHHVGERVFGSLLPFQRDGTLAEYVAAPFERMLALPGGVRASDAACLPISAGTALQGLTDAGRARSGTRVLVIGAAGGVGHFAVQVAKHLGAHVTAVCSGGNRAFVSGLGADAVIDYAVEDCTARVDAFDVIFDAASVATFARVRRALAPGGVYLNTVGNLHAAVDAVAAAVLTRLASRQRAVPIVLNNRRPMWERLLELHCAGVLRPHIERTVTLAGVADAQRAMETGHGRGKIVVDVAQSA